MTRIALFTDTLNETNGIGLMYKNLVAQSDDRLRIDIFYGESSTVETCFPLKLHFSCRMPLYQDLRFYIPSRANLSNFDFTKYDAIQIATPSFIGRFGTKVAHRFRKPLVGFYHTDILTYLAIYLKRGFLPSSIPDIVSHLLMKLTYSHCNWIICQNKQIASRITRDFGFKNTIVCKTGVDTELFSPISSQSVSAIRDKWGIAPESFVCLYVGRVSVEKNIEALRHLIRLKHNVTVVVVGSGPLLSQLRQRLPFVFIGELSHEQLPELYQAADCFVMPSFSETYGNVLLESLACGLPVVCHSEYVNSSVVQHESMGLVFNDPESLLDAVQWMIDHPAELNVMGSSALKYTQQHSWEHAYTDLVDIYTEILS